MQINFDKESQILDFTHHREESENNKTIVSKQIQELNDIQAQLELEQLEKKHLWKVLKSVKQFLKSDESFESLLVMLNEYIILLEQLMFDKKQKNKKLGVDNKSSYETE